MNMASSLKIELVVRPDLTWDFEITGDMSLTTTAVGAWEIARQNIISNYLQKMKAPGVANNADPEYNNNVQQSGEVRVSKSGALNAYLDHRTKIEKRITAIAKSDDRQEFIINKTLLDNI